VTPVSSGTAREVRFGVSDGRRFSQYWTVKSLARPELVIAGNRTGKFLHLTMHEDPASWHIKVTLPTGMVEHAWEPPKEIGPGLRRLVRLLVPVEAVRHGPPTRSSDVVWYAAPDEQTWVEFTILHSIQGDLQVRNADVLGRVRLADASTAVAIARIIPAEPGTATLPVPDPDELRRLWAQSDTLAALVHGTHDDGCLWFLQLQKTPRDAQAEP
jgi:hypothetical protein